ncbi:hypothetical protein [Vibrio caribbeanicus]|jgi:hypothetical protein|uniref:Uncharacterized protein n=1 Tax=Vibrio caribbeanicus ATCC BAA-2122 TaxID=796620 RepID=E3BHB4_9VIBR|nr:hypothetical protein [Vibrio caribbeanicus]EFP97562.1 hypothetical protein VIBC2010_17774 [Vibrio caribbeanicus ATCC BAA-2122]
MSLANLKQFSPLSTLISLVYNEFQNKQSSDKLYKANVPLIKMAIEQGFTLKDKMLRDSVDALESLAPFGARRRNFERRYLVDERSIMNLPNDPDKLSYGYWW